MKEFHFIETYQKLKRKWEQACIVNTLYTDLANKAWIGASDCEIPKLIWPTEWECGVLDYSRSCRYEEEL